MVIISPSGPSHHLNHMRGEMEAKDTQYATTHKGKSRISLLSFTLTPTKSDPTNRKHTARNQKPIICVIAFIIHLFKIEQLQDK